jgi:CheY-like chemotaxis protein
LRKFVRMALDELPIELTECADVASALPLLLQAPFDLILTDLMMPGESGLGLLQRLKQTPALRGQARVIVFSAALNADMRRELAAYDIWRMLDKPISVMGLESSVRQALADRTPAPLVQEAAAPSLLVPAEVAVVAVAAATAAAAPIEDRAKAMQLYFEGSTEIFEPYRAACLLQFPVDLAQGQNASAAADLPELRRVAHSLKSVLQTLGYFDTSEVARQCEATSHAGDLEAARRGWATLASQLQWIVDAIGSADPANPEVTG